MNWPCPDCGSRTRVVDSRINADGVRRRHACIACARRFTTIEVMADTSSNATRAVIDCPECRRKDRVLGRILDAAGTELMYPTPTGSVLTVAGR